MPVRLSIRAMTPADAPAAIALGRAEGWRDRTSFYEMVFRTATCQALAGEVDGRLVAIGLATVNGPVGWLGALIVDRAWRGRGIGRAMTEELMRRLQAAGCETLSLEATDAGRPLYERLGFRFETCYHQLQADHLDVAPPLPDGARLRPMQAADLPAVFALDRAATAEDRSVPLRVLAEWHGGRILERDGDPGSSLAGFLLPAERAYGVIVAPRPDDGLFLLDLHRTLVPAAGQVRAGVPHEHEPGWRDLLARGWLETWRAPRMLIGPSPAWRADWIWGQINSAMG